jgi:hypothetical protein
MMSLISPGLFLLMLSKTRIFDFIALPQKRNIGGHPVPPDIEDVFLVLVFLRVCQALRI